ncbi:hypothetical protein HOY82DRAFT_257058 [Tuber indicum]|nr:hypothetical protein HOY82DRAFT_257058 [Tuber indicum]
MLEPREGNEDLRISQRPSPERVTGSRNPSLLDQVPYSQMCNGIALARRSAVRARISVRFYVGILSLSFDFIPTIGFVKDLHGLSFIPYLMSETAITLLSLYCFLSISLQ